MHSASSSAQEPTISLHHLHRIYHLGGEDIHAVNDITVDLWPGYMTAVVGPSGSGKTTLLNLMAGLDRPSDGEVRVLGRDLNRMTERERLEFRLRRLSIIFQNFGLLPLLTARENVAVPLRLRKMRPRERETRVDQALAWVDLSDRAHHRPYELSGGEQQRVAIARALVEDPALVLADEPTGQVDSEAADTIFDTLHPVNQQSGVNVIIVTHDHRIARRVPRAITIRDGYMTTELRRTPTNGDQDEDEYIILDHGGRLQIPQAFIDELALKDRVQLRMSGDQIVIRRA
jgi:ABC-type lipoprotein export system ATPase subunit